MPLFKIQTILGFFQNPSVLTTPLDLGAVKEALKRVPNLVAQNRESRIARFPESRARNRQESSTEKQKNELNRSKVESQKIDSESPSESQLTNA